MIIKKKMAFMVLGVALSAAACGAGGNSDATQPSTTRDDAGTEGALSDRRGEGVSFTVGLTGNPDYIGDLALKAALERMRELGYEAETPYLTETELVTDSVVRGDFQFGFITPPALVAYENGATDLRIIGSRNPNDWAIVGQAGLDSCDDLDGKSFAIHSEGSVMAAVSRKWRDDACTEGSSFQEIIIAGSQNRAAALMAGQIDATAVQIGDLATLQEEYGDNLSVLSRQWQEAPELVTSAMYVNRQWAEQNRQAVVDLLRFMNEVAREWDQDADAFAAHIKEVQPTLDDFYIDYFAHELGAGSLFPTDGGIDQDALQTTIDFFEESGTIEGTVTAADILDMSYLEQALGEAEG